MRAASAATYNGGRRSELARRVEAANARAPRPKPGADSGKGAVSRSVGRRRYLGSWGSTATSEPALPGRCSAPMRVSQPPQALLRAVPAAQRAAGRVWRHVQRRAQGVFAPQPPLHAQAAPELLVGYDATVEALRRELDSCRAGDTATFCSYVFESGASSDALLSTLRAAARRGVHLRLGCDRSPLAAFTRWWERTDTLQGALDQLAADYPDCVEPLPLLGVPNHSKFLLVSRQGAGGHQDSAIVGGINIGGACARGDMVCFGTCADLSYPSRPLPALARLCSAPAWHANHCGAERGDHVRRLWRKRRGRNRHAFVQCKCACFFLPAGFRAASAAAWPLWRGKHAAQLLRRPVCCPVRRRSCLCRRRRRGAAVARRGCRMCTRTPTPQR